jgi:tetratricopeptide (TPR) repeat protein
MKLRQRIKRAGAMRAAPIKVGSAVCLLLAFLGIASAQTAPATSANQPTVLAKARTQLAHGDLADAESAAWSILNSNPNDEEALALLASIRVKQRRYPEAESLFRRVLQIDTHSLAAHRGLARALMAENRLDEAIEDLKAAVALAPEDISLKVEIAHLYAGRGQFKEALSVLQPIPPNRFPVEAIPVKAAALLALNKNADVGDFAEQAKNSPAVELELAEVFLDAKLPDQAQQSLALAEANRKKRPARFYYLQGRILAAKNQPEAALSSFNQAIAADPKSAETLVAIAELDSSRNRHADAVALLQKALKASPDDLSVLRHLVVEATKAGDAQASRDAASALSEKSPDNPDDLYLAGAALLQENAAGASTVLEKYVALRPDNARAWLGLGMAYVQQKKFAEARAPLERSVKLDANIAEAEYELGVVARNAGGSEEAIPHFQRAVQLQPQHEKALWNLGNLYLQSGELPKAQDALQSAEKLDPNNVETEYDLGLVLSKMGKPELAKEHFDRYHKLKDAEPPAERDAR